MDNVYGHLVNVSTGNFAEGIRSIGGMYFHCLGWITWNGRHWASIFPLLLGKRDPTPHSKLLLDYCQAEGS